MKSGGLKLLLPIVITLHLITTCHSQGQWFLTNGLVAYYPLNGDAHDESGHGFNGTISTNCSFTTNLFGNPNSAIFLANDQSLADFNTARIDIPANVLNSLASGTISAWINPYDIRLGDIVAKQHDGVNSYAVFSFGGYANSGGGPVQGNPGTLYFHPKNSSSIAASTATITTQTWQHVVVIFTSASCSFYINGTLCGTAAGNYSVPNNLNATTTSIGCWYGVSGWGMSERLRLSGAMDNVRIYNRALSGAEIRSLYFVESGNTLIDLGKAVYPKFSNLVVGAVYQLQASTNLVDWTNSGSPFTATSSEMISPNYFNVDAWNQLYFRNTKL